MFSWKAISIATRWIVALFLLSLSTLSTAQLKVTPWNEWSTSQQVGYVAMITAHQIDWAQTRTALRRPGFYELNPLIGRHPSTGTLDRYFVASGLLLYPIPWICNACRRTVPIVASILVLNISRNHFHVGIRARW
jgi:hypothetical protein